MSWFWKGLFLGQLLTRGRSAPKQSESPSVLDPTERYLCKHCNAEIHADDKWCHKCDGILTDEYKVVEVTYTQGQIIGWIIVTIITAIIGFAILHYIFGWV
jgi:hypothetical protein